jgi:hypothetical protein
MGDNPTANLSDDLAGDMLQTAGPLAVHVFGEDSARNRRRIYHLHETGQLPTFIYAGLLSMRKSRYAAEVQAAEAAADAERAARFERARTRSQAAKAKSKLRTKKTARRGRVKASAELTNAAAE